jgi:hypothetical protein
MIKTILIVTLIAAGQPPTIYRQAFDRPIDCWRARWDALEVYAKAYGYGDYQKGLNFIIPTPTDNPVQIQVDCVASEKDTSQSN